MIIFLFDSSIPIYQSFKSKNSRNNFIDARLVNNIFRPYASPQLILLLTSRFNSIPNYMKRLSKYYFYFITLFFFSIVPSIGECATQISSNYFVKNDTIKYYKSINVKSAFKEIKVNANNPDFIILDVRTTEDFQKDHIANAINIDFKSKDFSVKLDQLDRNKIYLVNCYGGFRSKNTMEMMKMKGFTRIYNMKGGIIKWRAKGLPLVKL
jgi:rhodanese-related sulfurtransferase